MLGTSSTKLVHYAQARTFGGDISTEITMKTLGRVFSTLAAFVNEFGIGFQCLLPNRLLYDSR